MLWIVQLWSGSAEHRWREGCTPFPGPVRKSDGNRIGRLRVKLRPKKKSVFQVKEFYCTAVRSMGRVMASVEHTICTQF